jgi:putative membrane protein
MKTKLFKKEIEFSWKRFLVITILLLIPFLYSFFFLKAFWDPYARMKNIPVAIVNFDKGDKGKEILKKLQGKNVMKMVVFTNEKEAISKLYSREVYAVIIIPEDFTGSLEKAGTSERKEPIIRYLTNKKSNFITSQIYDRAMIEVQKNIENEVSSQAVTILSDTIQSSFDKVKVIRDGFHTMNDGTNKLNDGAVKLDDGAQKLNDGIVTLKNGYKEFNSGIRTYANNMDKLSAGYETFDSGINKYVAGVNKAADGLDQISAGVVVLGNKLDILKLNKDFKKLYNGAKLVQEQKVAQQLKEGGDKILEGSGKVKSSIGAVPAQLPDKPVTLSEGIHKLSNASSQVQDGIAKLADGSSQFKNGTSELAKGTNILHTGVNLATQKFDSEIKTNEEKASGLTGFGKFMKESVAVQTDNKNNVSNYGVAFAPYFISLSLWVGALVLLIVLFYDARDRFHIFSRNYYDKNYQLLAYLGLIIIQATLFSSLIYTCFDFNLTNDFLFILSIFLISASFFMIIYFFILAFDDFGKLLAIVLLIVQLCASGGTFPIETTPAFFEKVYPFMPMRYSIGLIKESIVDIEHHFLTNNLAMIIGLFIVFLILNLITIKILKYLKPQPGDEDSNILEI